MSGAADLAQKAWTEAELEALPEDGFIHEVVGGELVMSPKNDFFHGDQSRQGISRSLWLAHQRKLIGSGGFLDGENLLPGFRYPIADLFKDWEWE